MSRLPSSFVEPLLTFAYSVTSDLSREDMLSNLEGWLSHVKGEGIDPVLKRVETIAELHAREQQGIRA